MFLRLIRSCCFGLALILAAGGESSAQESTPEALAVAYVIETDGLDSLGMRLALDITAAGGRETHDAGTAEALRRVAEATGARVASLRDVEICPPSPRPVETYHQGCRFKHGIQVLLQANDPEQVASGISVWVHKHYLSESLEHQRWNVFGHSRQVLLARGADGERRVIGFGPAIQRT